MPIPAGWTRTFFHLLLWGTKGFHLQCIPWVNVKASATVMAIVRLVINY